jgi:hypothetical protein
MQCFAAFGAGANVVSAAVVAKISRNRMQTAQKVAPTGRRKIS